MIKKKYFRTIFIITMLAAGCSSSDQSSITSDSRNKAPEVIGTQYTTIQFSKGKFSLSKNDKKQLADLAKKAEKDKREIDEIRVLAWADSEYPDPNKKSAPQNEILLASHRAQEIKEYLEEDLLAYEDVDAYNMARRPDFLSKLLQDDEFEVKKAFEATGATATTLQDGNISYSKASKALVIIDYEGDEDNLK